MTAHPTRTSAEIEAEIRALRREARAAKRAEKAAAEAALLDAKQALGVWLCGAVGADSVDRIETLKGFLDPAGIDQAMAATVVGWRPLVGPDGEVYERAAEAPLDESATPQEWRDE